MIYPKLQASQELALHRVTVQQHGFVSQLVNPDTSNNFYTTSLPNSSANVSVSGGSFPRPPSNRGELTSPLTLGSAGATIPFFPNKNDTPSLAPITGGGTNSTAQVSIVRPGTRVRQEWTSALEDIDPFVLPDQQIRTSQPSTRRFVTVHYIADQYDRQWLARRATLTTTTAWTKKGKSGSIDFPTVSSSPLLSSSSRHNISLSLFEDLITAFEVGSYYNAEIPVQRQPVSRFDGVLATGADVSVVEEVRQYWLGKRQALGGNVPCISSLHMNVREDNQMTICHNDILQYCPLPFNYRDWSIAVMQRRIPRSQRAKTLGETVSEVKEEKRTELVGQKRGRRETDAMTAGEKSYTDTIEEEEAAERREWRALLSSGLNVAQALLEREECKLAHTHLAIYELALLRRTAMLGRDPLEGGSMLSAPLPWVSDEALQEDWVADAEGTEEFHDSMGGGFVSVAVESVMAIDKHL